MYDFEKMGSFYLGRTYDVDSKKTNDSLLLYDSKDLVTHAVCVGMTGSGKTGLCLTVLEEAAIDGVPAIVIDPKGDLANLLLAFPQLRGEDFAPWVNPDDARKKGLAPDEYATQQAQLWTSGLKDWGQDGNRIQRMLDAAEFAIYTPGSNAGIPVSVLKSFSSPPPAILEDAELLRERIASTASGLLGLLGIDADPLQSREHILISTILNSAWKQRGDLDLAALIGQIQNPPVTRIGVLDLESFYPSKERFTLAMRLNNLLAAPGFEAWVNGQPLDVDVMLHSAAGKPRVSIFSIAHLTDAERMFFVTMLLGQVLSWTRAQPGTTSLRAILYMDEIFGYFPPISNPPSKGPLLTLLKQARAFGVGIMLATQNPVDLDYKGLANTGTWFIGRLQTERDKARVLEGLEGAAAGQGAKVDRQRLDQIVAGLGNRVFLMNNVHEDAPEVFQVRWTLSYLRGPLTRSQIKQLMDQRGQAEIADSRSAAAAAATSPDRGSATTPLEPSETGEARNAGPRPILPPEIVQFFIPLRGTQPSGARLIYQPMVLGSAKVYFQDAKSGVNIEQPCCYVTAILQEAVAVDWQSSSEVDLSDSDLEKEPASGALFAPVAPEAAKAKSYENWKKSFADMLFRSRTLELLKSPGLKQLSNANESERDFRVRLQQAAREQRDQSVAKLREKFAPKIAALQEKIRRARQTQEKQAEQATQQKMQTAISFGATVLGALFGRKAVSASTVGKATTAMRSVSRSIKESQDVTHAAETVEVLQQQLADLDAQCQSETQSIESKIDPMTEELESIVLRLKKTNITVRLVALAWAPHWQQADGSIARAW